MLALSPETEALVCAEALVLAGRNGPGGRQDLDDDLATIRAEIIPDDERLARLAIEAFTRFGKGVHSRARLNFGDCATYALARSLDAPHRFGSRAPTSPQVISPSPTELSSRLHGCSARRIRIFAGQSPGS